MAIQHRRGAFDRFDPTRLLPGEWAVVLSGDASASDGMAAYICFAAGTVKRVATYEDMAESIANANEDLIAELTKQIAAATSTANTAASNADTATGNANAAAERADTAADNANTAAASANSARSATETATSNATDAAGRANTAADEAEAFLEGFIVEYENLSDECKQIIAQSAGAGASVISDEQGIAIIDDMAAIIIAGREGGTLSDAEGISIINDIFA